MKRTEDDLPKDYVLEQREVGESFQFRDFSVDTETVWNIHALVNFSENQNQTNGIIYRHKFTGRPVTILMIAPTENEPGEYQVCYMQKMIHEETGNEIDIHCFDIYSGDDVGNQMTTLMDLLAHYYYTEMSHLEGNGIQATVDEMIAFLKQDADYDAPVGEERKIVKAKRNSTPVADSDKM